MNTKILSALLGAMGLLMSAGAVAQMHDGPGMRHDAPPHRSPVAKCRDGSVSYNHGRTCAHHGGVRRWYHR